MIRRDQPCGENSSTVLHPSAVRVLGDGLLTMNITPDHVASHKCAAAGRELLMSDMPGDPLQSRSLVVRA
jgi:hypothetical protein